MHSEMAHDQQNMSSLQKRHFSGHQTHQGRGEQAQNSQEDEQLLGRLPEATSF
jgi:hypothetical protein